ncbi:hypothetical protein, partial [Pseudomonas aeruginosa]|uniref:hypothetical protein n=1 Tax=Pseudomonas aeruginosa TaxID=287 RepID=UPI001F4AA71E
APLQLDQAASIQRRVTTCGGRRKTQPTVWDGLTTTVLINLQIDSVENQEKQTTVIVMVVFS